MNPNSFTESDEKRYIDALNFIALEASFGNNQIKLEYALKMHQHFAVLQSLVPKIHANISEIKALHLPKEDKKKAK